MRLYMIIVSRLRSDTPLFDKLRSSYGSADLSVEEVAEKMLERVKIMRVFDLVGVIEAVGEIREDLEVKKKSDVVPPRKTEIADSEDEDEDDSDDEMLLNTEPTAIAHSTSPLLPESAAETLPPLQHAGVSEAPPSTGEAQISFILIDNLAQVINPLLKKDYIQSTSIPLLLPIPIHINHPQHTPYQSPSSSPSQTSHTPTLSTPSSLTPQ
jgi:hypothetical protein